jgi:hypothetical protein
MRSQVNASKMQKVKIKMQSDRAKVKNLHFELSLKSNFCPLGLELDLTFELCHLLLFTSPIN